MKGVRELLFVRLIIILLSNENVGLILNEVENLKPENAEAAPL